MDIKNIVQKLIKKYRTNNPYRLAEELDIHIYHQDLGTIRGYYFGACRIKQVFLNADLEDYMERFVLSHEIGHSIMHPNRNTPFLQSTLFSVDKLEIQANKFAVELMIPDVELMEHWHYTMDQLAMFYGLPRNIIELRLKG